MIVINGGGPLYYLGNRNLSLPDLSGRMVVDHTWLNEHFSILESNHQGKKYKRCFEPFSGSASWSFAAMERGLAEEYVINDSDAALINTHRLMQSDPEKVKGVYIALINQYSKTEAKKEFFLNVISTYNKSELDEKSLLLPFIINHSWGGIVYHDDQGNIVYREANVQGKIVPGYFDEAPLSLEVFLKEVDRISTLLRSNGVIFRSGDFLAALYDLQPEDFVALNPPYPENMKARSGNTGMYVELYKNEVLHRKLVTLIQLLEKQGIDYYMTYGFYDPGMSQFILKSDSGRFRHFFRVLGFQDCAYGVGLDQMYFSSKFQIPPDLRSKLIPAEDVLKGLEMNPEEALRSLNQVAKERS